MLLDDQTQAHRAKDGLLHDREGDLRAGIRHQDSPPVGSSPFGRRLRVRGARGAALTAELSCLREPDRRPWLLAELTASDGPASDLAALTRAETRVLRLLTRGLSNREMARELFVSNETIKTHVGRVLRKLGTPSRSKAATLARDVWARG